jgi:hypothetical protein
MRQLMALALALAVLFLFPSLARAQRYAGPDGRLRVALAAVNRMIAGAVRGVKARETRRSQ